MEFVTVIMLPRLILEQDESYNCTDLASLCRSLLRSEVRKEVRHQVQLFVWMFVNVCQNKTCDDRLISAVHEA